MCQCQADEAVRPRRGPVWRRPRLTWLIEVRGLTNRSEANLAMDYITAWAPLRIQDRYGRTSMLHIADCRGALSHAALSELVHTTTTNYCNFETCCQLHRCSGGYHLQIQSNCAPPRNRRAMSQGVSATISICVVSHKTCTAGGIVNKTVRLVTSSSHCIWPS